jgi:hypothetical protein
MILLLVQIVLVFSAALFTTVIILQHIQYNKLVKINKDLINLNEKLFDQLNGQRKTFENTILHMSVGAPYEDKEGLN